MKKDFYKRERQCSDFDDRPIPELEDNLYSDIFDAEVYAKKDYRNKMIKQCENHEIIKNNENNQENA